MLVEKYSYVTGGEYADTPEQRNTKEETFRNKITNLDESVNSL